MFLFYWGVIYFEDFLVDGNVDIVRKENRSIWGKYMDIKKDNENFYTIKHNITLGVASPS